MAHQTSTKTDFSLLQTGPNADKVMKGGHEASRGCILFTRGVKCDTVAVLQTILGRGKFFEGGAPPLTTGVTAIK